MQQRRKILPRWILILPLLCQVEFVWADDFVISSRLLPVIPDSPGVASAFAGLSDELLIVAGGANFPTAPPWKGGTKVWHDDVFRLEQSGWVPLGRLPGPRAYGVSFQTTEGVLCVGGSDATSHHRDVCLLSVTQGRLSVQPWPPLPEPVANACGTMAGTTAIVAGGTTTPDALTASRSVWAINVTDDTPQWRRLPDLPGPGRILSVAAATPDAFYLFSGAALSEGNDGKPKRTYLNDAWKLELRTLEWTALPEMPSATVAAPSPAVNMDDRVLMILGGDDGTSAGFQPPERHPGFRTTALVFDVADNRWRKGIHLPVSRVTVPLVATDDHFLLPSGEIRPGVRSPEVFELTIRKNNR